jgi:hypothetical protein
MMTQIRSSSNAEAKHELGWEPRWASRRQGLRDGFAERSAAPGRVGPLLREAV